MRTEIVALDQATEIVHALESQDQAFTQLTDSSATPACSSASVKSPAPAQRQSFFFSVPVPPNTSS